VPQHAVAIAFLVMSKAAARSGRLSDQIQRDLAEIIRLELKDPRVGLVTITAVELTPDLAHARIFFTTLSETVSPEATAEVLQGASGFLRSRLAHALKTRTVPQLHFKYDFSVGEGMRLSRLIDEAVQSDHREEP
jgi:ribosome-binding factor A